MGYMGENAHWQIPIHAHAQCVTHLGIQLRRNLPMSIFPISPFCHSLDNSLVNSYPAHVWGGGVRLSATYIHLFRFYI
jgi:hypothetical protein